MVRNGGNIPKRKSCLFLRYPVFNTSLIHTSFTYRKLNMDEICGLKSYLSCVHCTYITKNFIEFPQCAKKVIFSTEFVLLDLNPHFYEVNQEVWKRPCAWRNFKNIFCVLSGYPKKPFRTQKLSIFNFRYVKEVWASGLLGVKYLIQNR